MADDRQDHELPAAAPEDTREFWTAERRAEAVARPYQPGAPTPHAPPGKPEPGSAKPTRVEGTEPAPSKPIEDQDAGPTVQSNPFRIKTDWIDFSPYCKIGKLFFTVGADPYTGSACVVGRNLLLTAAHNLYLNGVWSTRILFVPAATDNYGAFGDWWDDRAWVPDDWHQRESDGADVGLVSLAPGGNGRYAQPVGEVVGTLAYLHGGDPAGRSWRDVGYSRNFGDKRYMYAQDGEYRQALDGGSVIGMTGELAAGISGGPWLLWDDRHWPAVYGLHSFHNAADGQVFSPYFAGWVDAFIRRHQ